MSQIKSVEDMCQKVSARKGQINVIVNNEALFSEAQAINGIKGRRWSTSWLMGHQLPVS